MALNRDITKILKSDFNKNILALTSGTAVAQIIPIIVAPILTRIYTPADFGVLALYISIVSILSVIANGNYEQALLIPKNERDSVHLVIGASAISILFSILLLVIIFIFHDFLVKLLKNEHLTKWLYFIPLSVILRGLYNILTFYHTRKKLFKIQAYSNVLRSTGKNSISILLGSLSISGGLMIGQITSNFFGNAKMLKSFLREKNHFKTINLQKVFYLLKRYKKFPIYVLPGHFLNVFVLYADNFFISGVYSITVVGYYSLASKLISIPVNLIAGSLRQVYMEAASSERRKTGNASIVFSSTLKKLIILGVPIFFIAFFIVEKLFGLVFGEEWISSGSYARILIPLVLIRFITYPLAITNILFEQQKLSLILQIFLTIITFVGFVVAYFMNLDISTYLWIRTILRSFYYLCILYIVYQVANGKFKKVKLK